MMVVATPVILTNHGVMRVAENLGVDMVIRGLQFFHGDEEVCPHLVPTRFAQINPIPDPK